jgi:hypothetical protein
MQGTDGFTMACFKASDVPIGTPLYTAPTAAPENGDGRDAERYRAARTSAYVLGIRNPTPEEFDALVDGLIDVMAQQQGGA